MISYSTPARVGLLGNPSDGYGGRTLAMAVDGMFATVSVQESDSVQFSGPRADPFQFDSTASFQRFVDQYGYGTGQQLLAATYRTFLDLAGSQGWPIPDGVSVSFETSIPRGVGLAGSSALVISFLRGLLELCEAQLDDRLLPSLALSAEVDQLSLAAGLQDRVVQCYGGLVAMDFAEMTTDPRTGLGFGRYETLDPAGVPKLFLAYSRSASEPSSRYHNLLRANYGAGRPETLAGLAELAGLVPKGKAAVAWGQGLGPLMTRNMQLRESLAPISSRQMALIDAARAGGLDATFSGSGGAIVGVWTDDSDLDQLRIRLGEEDGESVTTVQPIQTFLFSR